MSEPFTRLPLRFDVQRLEVEVAAFAEDRWLPHPQDYAGNSVLPLLVSENGGADSFEPPIVSSDNLAQSPYMAEVLAAFGTVLGRARLMRLAPGANVPQHVDIHHYWRKRVRIHVPIVTHGDVVFRCGDDEVHMQAGDAWVFDNWRPHEVLNPSDVWRVHLVVDTCGTAGFWRMAEAGGQARYVPHQSGATPRLAFERYGDPSIFSPDEMETICDSFAADGEAEPANNAESMAATTALLRELVLEWRAIYSFHGASEVAAPYYRRLLNAFQGRLAVPSRGLKLASNGMGLRDALTRLLTGAVRSQTAPAGHAEPASRLPSSLQRRQPAHAVATSASPSPPVRFDRPAFIVAAPRSGSTWLFETLSRHADLWTLGGEGHRHVERIHGLSPPERGFSSNRLTEDDADVRTVSALHRHYTSALRDSQGHQFCNLPTPPDAVRFLEKTPKNALRIPFLKAAFPDARFIFLHRSGRQNASSIIEAWRSGRFVTYPGLPGWTGQPWSLALIPGWRDLIGAPLGTIAKTQWQRVNEIMCDDLSALAADAVTTVGYDELVNDRADVLRRLLDFIEVDAASHVVEDAGTTMSHYTLSRPDPDKWRRNEDALSAHLGEIDELDARLAGYVTA